MKIVRLSTYHAAPRWLFLKIETDEGITGWGEPVIEGRSRTVEAAVHELGDYLIGKDPARINDLWQTLYRGGFYRGGAILMSAIAGIECGKRLARGSEARCDLQAAFHRMAYQGGVGVGGHEEAHAEVHQRVHVFIAQHGAATNPGLLAEFAHACANTAGPIRRIQRYFNGIKAFFHQGLHMRQGLLRADATQYGDQRQAEWAGGNRRVHRCITRGRAVSGRHR